MFFFEMENQNSILFLKKLFEICVRFECGILV